MGILDDIKTIIPYKRKITLNYLYNIMNDKVKSIMTIPIIGISYKVKNSKKNNIRTTVCKIRWINPTNGNIQCSYGNAMCNPNDTFNEVIGQHIAESRAKINMYNEYCLSLRIEPSISIDKHSSLAYKERLHLSKLIENIK